MLPPFPLVIATSGSAGRPKQVVLSERAVLASAYATAARLGGHGTWVLALPETGIAGRMVTIRSHLAGHDPVRLTGSWEQAVAALPPGRRYASLVPTQLHRALDTPDADALADLDAVLLGGAAADSTLVEAARAAGITVVRTYGMSETCGGCVYDGVPLDGVAVRVIDGRVEISGPVLFDGYVGEPFVGQWFGTSDLGEIRPDGRLVVTGRVDDVIVSGGLNVPGPAVEAALRGVAGVEQVAVLGVADAEWGQRVVAFVVGQTDLATLRAAVRPRTWAPRQLVSLPALPVLANGKIDRMNLRALAEPR